ncbi:hypothetical protein BGZ68_001458 [Mortierella alpina]|nr:hypothetical protein BGZ68_001458 [Mortierella alpina]
MDVPEIRAMVALHLCQLTFYEEARKHLAVCARVCKDWHSTFKPFLYYYLSLRTYYPSSKRKTPAFPPVEEMQANSHLVQELNLALFSTQSLTLQHTVATLRNLKKLGFRAMYLLNETAEIDWLSLRPLLVNNRGIQELSIANITHPNCLVNVAEDCTSRLTTLRLSNMTFDWSQLLPVLTNCRQLRKLECSTCRFVGSLDQLMEVTATSRPVAINIAEVLLHQNSGVGKVSLVDWVRLCPRLETLMITKDRATRLGPDSQFSPGPQLSNLQLDCRLLKDTELTEVLTRCTSLTELTLERASVSRHVFAALSSHFGSLVSLDLSPLTTIEQWMIKRIFEGCPRLEELYLLDVDVNSLYDSALDDQEDLPWACRDSLKNLWIMAMQMSLDGFVNNRFLKQLMNLKQLQRFTIKAIYRGNGARCPLEFSEVPGDTPEAHLLSSMCKVKDCYGVSVKDPTWKLLREAWPRLLHFEYVLDDDDPYYSE